MTERADKALMADVRARAEERADGMEVCGSLFGICLEDPERNPGFTDDPVSRLHPRVYLHGSYASGLFLRRGLTLFVLIAVPPVQRPWSRRAVRRYVRDLLTGMARWRFRGVTTSGAPGDPDIQFMVHEAGWQVRQAAALVRDTGAGR